MAYRVVSRFIGILGMFLWTFPTLMLVWLGIFHRNVLADGLWVGYLLFLSICCLTMFSNFQLLMATEKGINPSSAVDLCQLWLLVYSFSFVIWINLLFFILFVQAKLTLLFPYCTFIILNGVALYYVNLYEKEMAATIPRSLRPRLVAQHPSRTEIPIYHIPIMDRTNRTIISVDASIFNKQNVSVQFKKQKAKKPKDKLPSYEEAQDSQITDPSPPHYDTLFPRPISGYNENI